MRRPSDAGSGRGVTLPDADAGHRAPLRLRPGDVDLWRAPLDEHPDEAVDLFHALLSPNEEERAAKFYFARDRRRFIVGRGILRVLVSRYVGGAPAEVGFGYSANGKPRLVAPETPVPLHFNLAHSEGIAVYAFTRVGDVGIDLERVRDLPDWEHIAATCFSLVEQSRMHAAPPNQRRTEFFHAWTRQEALLKATGLGFGGAELGCRAHGAPDTDGSNPAFPGGRPAPLKLFPLRVAEGFAAALAVGEAARWATCFTWDHLQILTRGRAPRRSRRVRLEQTAQPGLGFL